MNKHLPETVLILDCENIGLYGETYAVASAVYSMEYTKGPFLLSKEMVWACDPLKAEGSEEDRLWCTENIPCIPVNCHTPRDVCGAFAEFYASAKEAYPGVVMAGECIYPVEVGFLGNCVTRGLLDKFAAPYPFHEIASFMAAAGMDPMATYDRLPNERPKHDPIADVRQSARLLHTAIWKLKTAA